MISLTLIGDFGAQPMIRKANTGRPETLSADVGPWPWPWFLVSEGHGRLRAGDERHKMTTFSATDAGLVGFKLAREHPRTILVWGLLLLASSLVTAVVLALLAGPAVAELQSFAPDASTNPSEIMAIYAKMLPAVLVLIPLSLIYSGVLYAGANRLVLRPGDGGVASLKLGADELRQVGLLLLVSLILVGVYLLGGVAIILVSGLVSLISRPLAALLAMLGVIALVGGVVFVAVRLSLASAITFATGRIAIAQSWQMTKGRFWPLLGAYLLAGVMGIIVSLLAIAIFFAVAALIVGIKTAGAQVMSPDMSTLAAVFSPLAIIHAVFTAAVSALTSLIWLCPPAVIYQQLVGPGADTFD
jgi:hypothetical protein